MSSSVMARRRREGGGGYDVKIPQRVDMDCKK
jgi:hypothetical protein